MCPPSPPPPPRLPDPCVLTQMTGTVATVTVYTSGAAHLILPLHRGGERRVVATLMGLGGIGLVGLVLLPVRLRRKAVGGVLFLVIIVLCFGTSCATSFAPGYFVAAGQQYLLYIGKCGVTRGKPASFNRATTRWVSKHSCTRYLSSELAEVACSICIGLGCIRGESGRQGMFTARWYHLLLLCATLAVAVASLAQDKALHRGRRGQSGQRPGCSHTRGGPEAAEREAAKRIAGNLADLYQRF